MKKSQLFSFVLALLFVFFMGRMSVIIENHFIAGQGTDNGNVVINQLKPDEGGNEGEGDAPTSSTTVPEATSPESTVPETAPPETIAQSVDLGPDIELGEGITDARAQQAADAAGVSVMEGGSYTSKVEVALYIHTFGHVPDNYISKTKAKNAGWVSGKGNLWDVLPGKSIGGGGFYNEQWNDEPLLPETPEGRDWKECDINYQGGYRGPERLVYSDDGLVFYTSDHYRSFERLY